MTKLLVQVSLERLQDTRAIYKKFLYTSNEWLEIEMIKNNTIYNTKHEIFVVSIR